MGTLLRDVRYALRQFAANAGTTTVSVLSLAVGIGALTTIFSLVNAFLFRPIAVTEPDRLFYAYESSADGSTFHSASFMQYRDLRDRARTVSGLAAFDVAPLSVSAGDDAQLSLGMIVSGNFFEVVGTTPAVGRFFARDEDATPGTHPVVVASHRFWTLRLGADTAAVGRTVQVNGQPFTVIGVAPASLTTITPLSPDLWVPIMMAKIARPDMRLDERGYNTFQLIARLAPGLTAPTAEAELDALARQISEANADVKRGIDLFPYTPLPTDGLRGVAVFMALLMTFASLILLVACGNVASMLLARAVSRRREIAIRLALGAARARLVRQLVTESILLFLLGATGALALAFWATRAMAAFKPPIEIPLTIEIPLDMRVMMFAFIVALVVGTIVGLVPALRATRASVAGALTEQAGTVAGRSRLRGALVVGQLAFTLLLLVGAGLVVRALGHAATLQPGFDPRAVYLASTDLTMHNYSAVNGRLLLAQWRDRVAALPSVTAVAFARRTPLGLGNSTTSFSIEGRSVPPDQQTEMSADYNVVSPEYFELLRVPMVAGRNFGPNDVQGAPRVAIVSAALARRYFGEPSQAVGKSIRFSETPNVIVGVAADTKIRSLAEEPRAVVYEAVAQGLLRDVVMLVRTETENEAIGGLVRAELRAIDPGLPLINAVSFTRHIGIALLPQRLAALVAITLGIAGLILAAIGVYGIVAFSVSQRTREIGIRIAVGATPGAVVALVAKKGLRLTIVGIGVGLVLAFGASRFMQSFLMGISPTDPLTFVGVAVLLGGVAFVASLIPARRAAKLDPVRALRE